MESPICGGTRNDDHWDVTLDSNLCGTAPSIDIRNQLFIYLFYLFYLNHYLSHWWLIMTIVVKNNGNIFLTLEQLHTFFRFFFQIVILFSNTVHYRFDISLHKNVTSQRPHTNKKLKMHLHKWKFVMGSWNLNMVIEKPEFETRIGLVERNVFRDDCNILVWNWSNTMNILSVVWLLLAWCFSTRASTDGLVLWRQGNRRHSAE